MARPPKKPELRMDKDLRIPVTIDQHRTVSRAAEAAGKDMAAWAREVLLKAAARQLA
jgi:hypothetical protein